MIKMYKYLFYAVLFALLAGIAVITGLYLTSQKSTLIGADGSSVPQGQQQEPVALFEVETVNKTISLSLSGRIRSQNRQELFPEVAGKIIFSETPFTEGINFNEGDTLIALDSEEMRLQLKSARSGFQTLVASLLPDIRLDYPDYLEEFEQWFDTIDPEYPLPEIPNIDHRPLRQFVASRGLFEQYYQVKSSEHQLEKFVVGAPFDGKVSLAKVEPDQNVSPQQHLGTFVDTTRYVLTSSARHTDVDKLKVGQTVEVSAQHTDRTWQATLSRINPSVSHETQQVEMYLELSGKSLREGMYLKGSIATRDSIEVARIPKSALHRSGHVIGRHNGSLEALPVEIHDVEREYIWVRGLRSGLHIIPNIEQDIRQRLSAPERDN